MKPRSSDSNGSKIAILSVYGKTGYGVASVIYSQIEILVRLGFCVDLYSVHTGGRPKLDGLNIIEVPGNVYGLKDWIESRNYCAVIAHTPPFHALLAQLRNSRTILYDHGEPPADWFPSEQTIRENLVRQKKTEILPHVDRVIAISRFIAKEIGWDPAEVILNGADHLWNEYPLADAKSGDRPRLLCVSRLGPGERLYKGVVDLAQLAVDLQAKVDIVIAGRGNHTDEAELKAKGLDVILNPTDRDLAVLYASANAVISFSRWEGFNLPLVEGGFYGCPGFALDLGAHREVTPFCFSGYDELKQYLEKSTVQSLRADGEIMKKFVSQFTWESNVRHLVQVIDTIPSPSCEPNKMPMYRALQIKLVWSYWRIIRSVVRGLKLRLGF
jgi:glycosyltransferase involved in cell wall biosynthesis